MAKLRLERYHGNPILEPRGSGWESRAVFNCAVAYDGHVVHMLYRAVAKDDPVYISRFGYASSSNGLDFQRAEEPVFEPQEDYEAFGCEDPRITRIGDRFYITYTALSQRAFSGSGNRVALASTTDFKEYQRHGVILPEFEDKDAVLFPEKIGGKYVMFHRIMPDIWIAYSDDLLHWHGHKVVMRPRPGYWDGVKIGAGAPPLKTECGWLLFYHGVDEDLIYRLGVALFDLHDPSKLIARGEEPILEPEEEYEREGDVPNVVFTCGAIEKDGLYYVYYGGADTVIGVATIAKDQVLAALC